MAKLTPTQIIEMGVTRLQAANGLFKTLASDLDAVASHNADKNNARIDAAPFISAAAAAQTIVNQLAAHVQAVTAPAPAASIAPTTETK